MYLELVGDLSKGFLVQLRHVLFHLGAEKPPTSQKESGDFWPDSPKKKNKNTPVGCLSNQVIWH